MQSVENHRQRSPKVARESAAANASELAHLATEEYPKSSLVFAALDGLSTAVGVFDLADESLTYTNSAFSRMFCAASGEPILLSSFLHAFGVPQKNAQNDANPVTAARFLATASDQDIFHPASDRWYSTDCTTANVSGRQCAVILLKDITERVQADQRRDSQRQQLMFTSKVMSVGEMAATLAHELNQPIGSVLNYLSGCMRRLNTGTTVADPLLTPITEAHRQAQRAAAIIERIRQFVRSREPKPSNLNLAEVVNAVVAIIEPETTRQRVDVNITLAQGLPHVCADRIMIEQVLHNLAKNAVEAMQGQATYDRTLRISAQMNAQGLVEVLVVDNGPGLSSQESDNVFSPFFSTKSDGLGIGLNICRSLIEYHGGTLTFSNNSHRGTTFCFTLPVATDPGETE